MIAHLRGTVAGLAPDGAVIEVGGVGMRVQCTPGTLAALKPGESAQVATSLVVREDSLTLFGFATDDERNVFELLQTASGVGPARVQPGVDLGLDREQPDGDVLTGGRPDDPDPDHGQRPAGRALDHADAAPGQPRIHPQHPDRVPCV